jgi:hypothetical protein
MPPAQGSGRFDVPERPVWYLSESPVHAVSEMLQSFRSRQFNEGMLRRFDRPLALVKIDLPDDTLHIVNLDDPAELQRFGLAPSRLASEDRTRTQAVARRVYASGAAGMRWWSKLSGDWHAVVLFLDRIPMERLEIGTPEPLTREHPAVISACRFLAMQLGAR